MVLLYGQGLCFHNAIGEDTLLLPKCIENAEKDHDFGIIRRKFLFTLRLLTLRIVPLLQVWESLHPLPLYGIDHFSPRSYVVVWVCAEKPHIYHPEGSEVMGGQ